MIINCSKCGNKFEKGCQYSWHKRCPDCNRNRLKLYNQTHKKQQVKYRQDHAKQRIIYDKEYYKTNMAKIKKCKRNRHLESRYGLTQEEYDIKLQEQNGVCMICGQKETHKHNNGKIRNLVVDHNHNTGIIRGLLCDRCNIVLGKNKEDLDLFQKQIMYLKIYQ